eukprot:TRINITY_DN5517_c0_g1_i2.p1 TRINITY_DN5517_c0_g1~~TRINITY_DN5517_c0_g1_i2.p1  ORF type:complete len:187 (+),score=44.22 TRINITY_DN5517_c0_g1_i2:145-705(+)
MDRQSHLEQHQQHILLDSTSAAAAGPVEPLLPRSTGVTRFHHHEDQYMASAGAAPGIGVGQHQANASSEVATTAGGGLHEDVDSSLRADKGVPPCALKLLVSNNMAGSLIGKAGQTIQNVQLQSGAVVKVSTSGMYLPGTQVRTLLSLAQQLLAAPGAADSLSAHWHCVASKPVHAENCKSWTGCQ